ncbi:DUF5988 family protein [Streptomyces sp. BHT-5-2]|uniref:DUF5988 family protein n=1 Tax=Streptomyces sp. BHT-5-2 TaxID=2866715 RepID=UPI001C8DC566|nr:DUF5988 family protein [Streptomyces sp. BHT-5-2]QZL04430.1 DUF5988 family protein [Streptomyces sp. BHT-5-2]
MGNEVVTGAGRLVVLQGGPEGVPYLYRLPDGTADELWVVVAYYGRHEHYESTGESVVVEGRPMAVFRWTHGTAIAE